MWLRTVAFVILGLFLVQGNAQSDADKYLLPWNLRPEHYDLTIFTHIEKFDDNNPDSFQFMGINNITVGVFYGDVSEIVLHSHSTVEIVSATVVNLDLQNNDEEIIAEIGDFDAETDKQIILVDPPLLNNGRYLISLKYTGINGDNLDGFYRSSYVDEDGVLRWLVTTQFESFGARQAFPCFDEPEYKATFRLTVHFNQSLDKDGYTAYFNTEIESQEIIDGERVITFQVTPRQLSTYLVAFVVANFIPSHEIAYFNSSYNGENATKPYRTISSSRYIDLGYDSLSQIAGPAALNIMTKNTGVGFGMTKSDQIAIPDFAAGAMENWGICTYREEYLLTEDTEDVGVVTVITHELAHQWFGDLVTLHWWSDLWLNEGFANFFEYQASSEINVDGLNTEGWDLIGQQVTNSLQYVLGYDLYDSTGRSLTYETYKPSVIDSLFDVFSYDKGGAVIRMWSHVLGRNLFYDGLNRYLNFRSESVGTPEILLGSWDGAVDNANETRFPLTISELFRDWHLQAGFPVVKVSRSNDELTITQSPFTDNLENKADLAWNVPISYSTDLELNFDNTEPTLFLLKNESSTSLSLKQPGSKWVVVNNQEAFYYRVDYDDENWSALFEAIAQSDTPIHRYNVAQIIDDSLNLNRVGMKKISHALNALYSVRNSREYAPWKTALRHLKFILSQFANEKKLFQKLKNFATSIVKPCLDDLISKESIQDEPFSTRLLKKELANFLCNLDYSQCNNVNYMEHPNLKEVHACQNVNINGMSTKDINALSSSNFLNRKRLLKTLPCNGDLLRTVLQKGLLKRGDLQSVITEASKFSAETSEIIYTYMNENHAALSFLKQRDIELIMINLLDNLNAVTVEQRGKLSKFDTLLQKNIEWRKSVRDDLIQYFIQNK